MPEFGTEQAGKRAGAVLREAAKRSPLLRRAFRATAVWAQELAPAGKGILKVLGWLVLVFAVGGLGFALLQWYESHQPVDHDTPVWIQGDWLVGEFRVCQMRTKTVPEQRKDLDSLDKLPRLFCGEDANGLFDFQTTAVVREPGEFALPPQGGMYFIGVTADDLAADFHVLPVRYFGFIQSSSDNGFIYDYDRTDKWVISWRCQRLSESLTCKALD